MRRRDFITLLGGAAVAKPFAARAQEPSRIYRLGSLFGSQRTAPYHVAIFEALRQNGFVDGQNLLTDPHGYGLRVDQVAAHAVEVVDARVDVILCTGDVAIRAAQQATKTIPILASTEDMVGSGFVHPWPSPMAM
jgi:putative ABC transport system substrate-binding protein